MQMVNQYIVSKVHQGLLIVLHAVNILHMQGNHHIVQTILYCLAYRIHSIFWFLVYELHLEMYDGRLNMQIRQKTYNNHIFVKANHPYATYIYYSTNNFRGTSTNYLPNLHYI